MRILIVIDSCLGLDEPGIRNDILEAGPRLVCAVLAHTQAKAALCGIQIINSKLGTDIRELYKDLFKCRCGCRLPAGYRIPLCRVVNMQGVISRRYPKHMEMSQPEHEFR